MDYKDTLNLPQTDFPMRANLPNREPQILQRWEEIGLNDKLENANKETGESFILHDGPPYANGHLHIGHALNKTIKDMIVRSHQMMGFDARYIPGWDCHGLPIELMVEKSVGKAGDKVNAREFRAACRDYAAAQVDGQRNDFKRLGVLGDWDDPYLTMNYETEANIVRALGKIVANGHLVKGYKPVYWSVVGASALAEAEVEYQDKTSFAIDVRFPVVERDRFAALFRLDEDAAALPMSVVIWTTTPWTLPSHVSQLTGQHALYLHALGAEVHRLQGAVGRV